MLASEVELGRARRVLLDGSEAGARVGAIYVMPPGFALATASMWVLPQNR